MRKPVIALTMGDPAGIGPEIVLKALAHRDVRRLCVPLVFGDAAWLERVAKSLRGHPAQRLTVVPLNTEDEARRTIARAVPVMDQQNVDANHVRTGVVSAAAGRASGAYIVAAVSAVLEGRADAVVTCPINKKSFSLGGWGKRYVGHTEMLADLTGAREARLMLVHGALRAVHVTSHIPLSRVPANITRARIAETIRITLAGLRAMGIRRPSIAVCGLNPHAGDGGVLGDEERRLIAPAIKDVRAGNAVVHGPLSADAVWPLVLAGRYHAGVAMYHDQGQIAIKLQGIGGAVNVTLGIPVVRTSPAHGTAFDIAGTGSASEASLVEAIRLAARMAARR